MWLFGCSVGWWFGGLLVWTACLGVWGYGSLVAWFSGCLVADTKYNKYLAILGKELCIEISAFT